MMKALEIPINDQFIGREQEIKQINEICMHSGSKILIVYGRRRIGKTELLEQSLRNRNLLKFEGRENTSAKEQMKFVMQQLSFYAEEPLLARIALDDWIDVLKEIALRTKEGFWTIYFEEVQ